MLQANRKDFVAVLAKEVMGRLVDTRTSQWAALAEVMSDAFLAREAMVWSADSEVQTVLADRGWDGRLPTLAGDFVFPAEFQYASKNGRALRRTYHHDVTLRRDGSGTVTTTVVIANPSPPNVEFNRPGVLTFITMYGPEGAVIGAGSDAVGLVEPSIAGHPARGWFRAVDPESEMTLKVVWEAPHLARPGPDGGWEYSLLWMGHPDHTGDVLNLNVELPTGWKWKGDPPPPKVSLDTDLSGSWKIAD